MHTLTQEGLANMAQYWLGVNDFDINIIVYYMAPN